MLVHVEMLPQESNSNLALGHVEMLPQEANSKLALVQVEMLSQEANPISHKCIFTVNDLFTC